MYNPYLTAPNGIFVLIVVLTLILAFIGTLLVFFIVNSYGVPSSPISSITGTLLETITVDVHETLYLLIHLLNYLILNLYNNT